LTEYKKVNRRKIEREKQKVREEERRGEGGGWKKRD
jgi:hypothetical protein